MFDKFKNRYVIAGKLVAETAIHIGTAGEEFKPGGSKNSFFRNAQGMPIIPGASLKGATRSFLEQFLFSDAGKEMFGEEAVCNEGNPCVDQNDSELKKFLDSKNVQNPKKLAEYLFGDEGADSRGKLCIVCRLFGSKYSGAKFNIRDAKVIEETFQNEYEIRSGVSIDRDLGISKKNHKFEVEVVPEGTEFSFRAILENAEEKEFELIKLLLHAMELGLISIGGMKSRGLGEMRLENARYQKIDACNIRDYLSGKEIPFCSL